jgi:hypothetical protein
MPSRIIASPYSPASAFATNPLTIAVQAHGLGFSPPKEVHKFVPWLATNEQADNLVDVTVVFVLSLRHASYADGVPFPHQHSADRVLTGFHAPQAFAHRCTKPHNLLLNDCLPGL